ncbi:MAG: tRNA pseudouridine(38-40) synthase TruA [Pseudomonadota bacterium]
MPRYALKIEYDGTPFKGWQRQKELPSVQGAVEAALAKLEPGLDAITAAGRTDTGVHALGQVADVWLPRPWDPFRLSEALNHHLKPLPVAVLNCAQVADDFSARFAAHRRHYLFRLISRRAPLALDAHRAWRVGHPLDLEPMQKAADALIGQHDFTTFRAAMCQAASPIKTLDQLQITQAHCPGGVETQFRLHARSFLHNQVRSIVGTLERVGAGAWPPERVAEALEAKDRAACGPVCPPHGLYLAQVDYPQDPFAP